MEWTVIVTLLALAQYVYFAIEVGRARGREGIKAPAIMGSDAFERVFRVHQNTLEVLVLLIPSLWAFSYYVSPHWGAGIGAVYLVGRTLYAAAYRREPGSRALGFGLSLLPALVLLVGGLIGAVISLVR